MTFMPENIGYITYESTRGVAPKLGFADTVMTGLASDGGLYVPTLFPRFSPAEWQTFAGLPFSSLAERLLAPFVAPDLSLEDLRVLCGEAWGRFTHPAVTPLRHIDTNLYLLELFHGPTLAFKDVALQFLGRLFAHILKKSGTSMTVVGATSGDTGSAAMEGLRGLSNADVFILYPRGRTSEVQRRQMTTIPDLNVHALAVEGTFDDCQAIVKALFRDEDFRIAHGLSSVNSINWARIAVQMVYYAYAALQLGAPWRQTVFSVPSANFGNILAGHYVRAMGLPIRGLICGSNQNDTLHNFFSTGKMVCEPVRPSLSPSMDIQVSSNFERLLFESYGRDGDKLAASMAKFSEIGSLSVDVKAFKVDFPWFTSARVDEGLTLKTMADEYAVSGEQIDPHTAVGLSAARQRADMFGDSPIVSLACAHPAKFPDAVEQATRLRPELPLHLKGLLEAPERLSNVERTPEAVKTYIEAAKS